uniref:Uncharacterized protein n=1 Tax=Rousettus aegyptiacus TaxID=9407 RepID=A0A7J8H1B9_ROUAE|nr:hypothetical protein HJG63_011168 [Rousettus aegyptiacus]
MTAARHTPVTHPQDPQPCPGGRGQPRGQDQRASLWEPRLFQSSPPPGTDRAWAPPHGPRLPEASGLGLDRAKARGISRCLQTTKVINCRARPQSKSSGEGDSGEARSEEMRRMRAVGGAARSGRCGWRPETGFSHAPCPRPYSPTLRGATANSENSLGADLQGAEAPPWPCTRPQPHVHPLHMPGPQRTKRALDPGSSPLLGTQGVPPLLSLRPTRVHSWVGSAWRAFRL